MVDLNVEMTELWGALGAPPAGRPHVIQFISARRGEGTSTVAREFARFASRRAGRKTWLVDVDLTNPTQLREISADPNRFGPLGPPVSASPDGSAFFTVQPPAPRPEGGVWPDAQYLVGHSIGGPRLWLARFNREALRGRQQAHVIPSADYWKALGKHTELIVVDCPPLDRSQAGPTIAGQMDQTVLVVAADQPDVRQPAMLRDAITAAGGRCAGMFFNRVTVEPPRFLKAILP